MRFWKSARLLEFLILESKLLKSIAVEGKKKNLKQSASLTLKRGTLFLCLVLCACLAVGIISKSYLRDIAFYYFEKEKVSCTTVVAVGIQSLVLDNFFL